MFPTCRRCCAWRWCSASASSSSSAARVTSRWWRWCARATANRLPDRPGARDVAYQFESLDYPATERRFNCYYAEFFPVARRQATAARPSRLRVHLHHPGRAQRARGCRRARAEGRRFDVLRFERAARVSAKSVGSSRRHHIRLGQRPVPGSRGWAGIHVLKSSLIADRFDHGFDDTRVGGGGRISRPKCPPTTVPFRPSR